MDKLIASSYVDDYLRQLKRAGNDPKAAKHYRVAVDHRSKKGRVLLKSFADSGQTKEFVGIVGGRGFKGRHRTVLVKDIRPFGIKFVFEEHIWLHYDKMWERIEPFVQGQKVLIRGPVKPYERDDGSVDYTIIPERITKL